MMKPSSCGCGVRSFGPSGSQDSGASCGARKSTPPFLRGSAPSPWSVGGNWWQLTASVFHVSEPFSAQSLLPPVATGCDRWAS
jgi:hypothetical protein